MVNAMAARSPPASDPAKRKFPGERLADVQALDGAGVWRHLARFEEAPERLLVIREVADGDSEQ